MEYTVFTKCGYQDTFQEGWGGLSLQGLLDACHKRLRNAVLIAWAAEGCNFRGGTKGLDDLRAESLAAGRLIEKTASGWVALGAEKQSPELDFDKALARVRKALFEQSKVEPASADLNAAMVLRDGPAKPVAAVYDVLINVPATAKPNPFPTTLRSPDCDSGPSDHLNASRHQMAGMSKS